MKKNLILTAIALIAAVSCNETQSPFTRSVDDYAVVNIAAPDLSGITDNGKEVLNLYRFAADEVDAIYWEQYFGDKQALLDGISDAVKTGLFQKGSWELHLPELFEDPKQTSLEYSLSDDLGGAMKIEDETLQADCRGIGEADVTVTATDSLGLSAELPVKLVEQNMTWIILMIALLVLLLLIALFFLRKRAGRKH